MSNYNTEEWFPVVDEEGNTVSVAPRSICHNGISMLLHPVVHLHLFNDSGLIYLQKRALTKDILPGRWDTSVGGHVSPGENIEDALKRETFEELGLADFEYEFIKKYVWKSSRERELVYSFRGRSLSDPVTNPDEIVDGRFWTKNEIIENMDKDVFTPNFEYEFKMLFIPFKP